MKKMIMVFALILAFATALYAESASEDDGSVNMTQLRNKIVRMKREMDMLMKDIVSTYPQEWTAPQGDLAGQDVRVDIMETDKDMVVKADLPGMEKDKIDITLEKSTLLKISGSREVMKKQTSPGVVKQERSFGSFERVLTLPAEGMNEGIRAVYKDGVLEVVIPKKTTTKEEKVKVKVI